MPQMAPINWLLLFIIFILTFIMYNIMNYYIYNTNLPTLSKKTMKTHYLNWKW